jgi:hypothetical protein
VEVDDALEISEQIEVLRGWDGDYEQFAVRSGRLS